jgi:hypothetical protein
MKPISSSDAEKSRKFLSLALQRISSTGQKSLSEQMGTSEATISRLVNGDLEKVLLALAIVGLKVVPADMQCYPPEKIQILLSLARDHLNQLETPGQLSFE